MQLVSLRPLLAALPETTVVVPPPRSAELNGACVAARGNASSTSNNRDRRAMHPYFQLLRVRVWQATRPPTARRRCRTRVKALAPPTQDLRHRHSRAASTTQICSIGWRERANSARRISSLLRGDDSPTSPRPSAISSSKWRSLHDRADKPPPDQGRVNVYLDTALNPSGPVNGWPDWESSRELLGTTATI